MSPRPVHYTTSQFSVLSISFEKANAEVRGRFAFFDELIPSFVKKVQAAELGDAFVVSTCNRTEIYITSNDYEQVGRFYCEEIGVKYDEFMTYAEVKHQGQALLHLFRVAAGLESQILGDFEIIGQIKSAYYKFKKEKKKSNSYLERALSIAVQISRRIKNETAISTGAASVSYAAVHYILNNSTGLRDCNILLLGTGEIGQNTLDNLLKHIPNARVCISNRTAEKAEKLSHKYDIPQLDYSDFKKVLPETDILIVATGAHRPILLKEDLKNAGPTLVLDLSIPNNVEPSSIELANIKLIDVDGLSAQIQQTLEQRKKEVPRALEIIDEMLSEFYDWEKKRLFAPRIHQLNNSLKHIERIEMHNIHRKHRYARIEDMELSNRIVQKLTNRFAKFIIEHPERAEEITQLMHEIIVEQPKIEFNEKH